ncbi:unnamed protein product [Brachionus calyciflorus]|uniref:Uncharacterized protein n=1 Tax=Brachionus calyciflorus TaxID=104777 RepID=A0A813MT18_9BILA|nr:unnamed protein product [Brachionus calyciflorus]
MKLLKTHIVEYFDDLKNEIDLNCENLLSSFNLIESEKLEIELNRTNFLEHVNRIFAYSLQKYEIVKELEYEQINFDDWEFCFFLPGYQKFGVLVLTSQYLSLNTRFFLRGKFSYDEAEYSNESTTKEAILASLMKNILEVKLASEIKDGIIDLRSPSQNVIESFKIDSFRVISLKSTDLCSINNLANTTHLNDWYLDLDVPVLEENLFSKFENIMHLELIVNEPCLFEPRCFNGLNNLSFLTIYNMNSEKLDENIFTDLKNLRYIGLRESRIGGLGENAFKILPNIEELSLIKASIECIESNSFKDLASLQYLNLTENPISHIPENVFDGLKNLAVLNLHDALQVEIDAKFFNNLENLEFLALIQTDKIVKVFNLDELKLPKLKFLAIDSKKVPNFDLNLEMLVIYGLEEFNENMFDRLTSLKGLVIDLKGEFFDDIKKELFKNMENLAYLVFNFDDLDAESLELIQNNYKYYQSFLKKSNVRLELSEHLYVFKISCYRTLNKFIKSEMKVNEITKSAIDEYHEMYLEF